MPGNQLCIAYYCSGHGITAFFKGTYGSSYFYAIGYGHATRVSAFTRHILAARTEKEGKHVVHIVSSTPKHIFDDVWDLGAKYRYAEIDPVIVQPIACVIFISLTRFFSEQLSQNSYRVDRRESLEVLKKFLANKKELLEHESQWLQEVKADCVFTDAAFLAW